MGIKVDAQLHEICSPYRLIIVLLYHNRGLMYKNYVSNNVKRHRFGAEL